MNKIHSLIVLCLAGVSCLFAGAGFYQDSGAGRYQKAVFNFGAGFEWKRLDSEIEGQYYGSKSQGDTWLLKGGEGYVWKDNGSDITSVALNYRIYKEGTTPPAFSTISLPWAENLGGNNQRWATTAASADIIAAANSSGKWYVQFYFSAATNGVNCASEIFWSNNSSNYTLNFDLTPIVVNLVSFTAAPVEKGILVEWRTASEINHAGFLLYKSKDAVTWQPLSTNLICAADESAESERIYRLLDVETNSAGVFYRLEAVSLDGTSTLYAPIAVAQSCCGQAPLTPTALDLHPAYPNPFNPATTLTFDNPLDDLLEITAYNTRGQRVAQIARGFFPLGKSTIHWSARQTDESPLPSGVYFIRLTNGASIITQKVIKLQ